MEEARGSVAKSIMFVLIFFMMSSLALAGTHHKKKRKPKPTPTSQVRIKNPVDAPDHNLPEDVMWVFQ